MDCVVLSRWCIDLVECSVSEEGGATALHILLKHFHLLQYKTRKMELDPLLPRSFPSFLSLYKYKWRKEEGEKAGKWTDRPLLFFFFFFFSMPALI